MANNSTPRGQTTGQNPSSDFDIVIVGQSGRLQYEALLLAASLKANAPTFAGTLYIAEPQAGPLWPKDPTMPGDIKGELEAVGAVILPFVNEVFGAQ